MNCGERELQDRLGTRERADAFQARQTLTHLNDRMRHFIGRQEMMFLATADAAGGCDNTFRAGPPGFVRVLDEEHLSWPEYRGNGVMASLGNVTENGHVGILMVDFFETAVGLHVNGRASIVPNEAVDAFAGLFGRLPFATGAHEAPDAKKTPERWVVVEVQEAYIHCSKHIPRLKAVPEDEQSDRRAGDVFKAKDAPRPWLEPEPVPDEIGVATLAEVPTHSASGRRLPLPVRK